MCTLTLLRERWLTDAPGPPRRWRLVFNRDEQRRRPPALPPARRRHGAVETVHPVDPEGGGAWIAATDHGLVLALLNGNDAPPADVRESRGAIIPRLAAAAVRSAADVPIDAIDPRRHRAFHLLIADDHLVVDVSSDGQTLTRRASRTDDRLLRTSSSFEPGVVCAWRRRLFAEAPPDSAAAQDAFHARAEPDHPARGVAMTRADACTVSVTTIDVFPDAMRMAYRALPGPDTPVVIDLPRLA